MDVETAWASLRDTVHSTALECLGPTTRKHKDWFDENSSEIRNLLEKKHQAYRAHVDDPRNPTKKDALKRMRSAVQLKLRQLQDAWLSNKADAIQSYADRKDMKNFYASLKEIYDPKSLEELPLS